MWVTLTTMYEHHCLNAQHEHIAALHITRSRDAVLLPSINRIKYASQQYPCDQCNIKSALIFASLNLGLAFQTVVN